MGYTRHSRARARERAGRRYARQSTAYALADDAPQFTHVTPVAAGDTDVADEGIAHGTPALAPVTEAPPAPEEPTETPASFAPPIADVPDEEPPFDAPDADDDIFRPPAHARRWSDPDSLDLRAAAPPAFPHEPDDTRPPPRAAPAISIHVSWARPAGAALAECLAANPLLARADVTDARGGFAAARSHAQDASPLDLLIIDSTLKAQPLLDALEHLQTALSPCTSLLVVGDVNDVTLLRELARRGVAQYFLAPANPDDIARAICDLYAETDRSHVIAVVGSRGGAGASTVAHNLAWSIAERQDVSTTLIELDFAFGATAFTFDRKSEHSLADGVGAPRNIDEAFIDRVCVHQTERLRLLPAPATLSEGLILHKPTIGALIRAARRTSAFVVLDVPHQWNACVKDVLERANDVLIVATPDLASLRNTKAMLDVLKSLRPAGHEPMIALSMVGACKGTEVSERDFAGAVEAKPILSFAFDPALFVGSAIKRLMPGEMAPHSAPARQFDDLACLITGRGPAKRKKHPRKRAQTPLAADAPAHAAKRTASEATIVTQPRRPRPLAIHRPRPRPRRHPGQPGTLRLTFALMALLASGMWYAQTHVGLDVLSYAIASSQ